jgi:hypothetical protein
VIAAAGGASGNTGIGASVAYNEIGNTVEAYILNATDTGTTADTKLTATNTSTIRSLAGAVGVGSTGGVGVGVAINRIDNLTAAHVSGASTDLTGRNLVITANGDSRIETIAIGLGAGGEVGVAGSVAVNMISSDTKSYIDGGGQAIFENNVGVIANTDESMLVAAGALAIGGSAAGVGASVVVNDVSGSTVAYLDGAATRVTAKAKDANDKLSVDSGALNDGVDLGKSVDLAQYASIDLRGEKTKKNVTGLAVNATGTQVAETLNAAIAGSSTVGVAINANVNLIGGSTKAYISGAQVNASNSGAGAGQTVDVTASNHAYGNGFVGNVSVGQVAVGAASDNIFSSARPVPRSSRRALRRWAGQRARRGDHGASSLAVGAAAGAVSVAGTGALAKFDSDTQAVVDARRSYRARSV